MALLRTYDVSKGPDGLVSSQNFPDISDAIERADALAKKAPEYLYKVFDSDMNVVYAR